MHPIDHYATLRRGQEELLRQAEYERMARKANLRKLMKSRYDKAFVNWLGTRMVRWGQRLEQFGAHRRLQSSSSASPHH